MKKSVVILIALIYVASIAVVGFLGLKANSYNDVIYVESIQILNDYTVPQTTRKKTIVLEQGQNTIQINCKVIPEEASDTKIIYMLASDCTIATVDENGLLVFTDDGTQPVYSVTLYIYSHQNTTINDELLIYYLPMR